MSNEIFKKMKKRLSELKEEMESLGPIMRGSVVYIGTKNKQYYFSLNKNKKTKLIYLGNKRVKNAEECSKNYVKLLEIIEEMTDINMQLIKNDIEIF
jgi:hypothetical protein